MACVHKVDQRISDEDSGRKGYHRGMYSQWMGGRSRGRHLFRDAMREKDDF